VWGLEADFEVPWSCGGMVDDEARRSAYRAYKLSAKRTAFVHRTQLTPENYAERMVQYKQKHFGNLPLHPAQTIRLMVLSGHFVLSPKWNTPGVGSFQML
jgi:hypothetical protein